MNKHKQTEAKKTNYCSNFILFYFFGGCGCGGPFSGFFFSLLRGSYWLEVGSFFPSSNQKQEQGFSEELSHIPSACVLSIKRDVACGALLHFISLFISFTNAWTVEYCIG